jgi:HPt (histidine-containing phosphotransfer) domain-containing protein
MSLQAVETEFLYSTLAADPDLAEIVEMFVDEMPARIENLTNILAARDWPALTRLAHQMKGACGSYGFHPLTPAAARLEYACKEGHEEAAIQEAVAELVALCQKVRPGTT